MKKIIFITIIIVFLFVINNLVHSIYTIWQKKDFVTEAQKELEHQKQENQRLKSELSYSQTREFIEKQARDNLFMVKIGEQRVLVPKDVNEDEVLPNDKVKKIPNWKKWRDLFF